MIYTIASQAMELVALPNHDACIYFFPEYFRQNFTEENYRFITNFTESLCLIVKVICFRQLALALLPVDVAR